MSGPSELRVLYVEDNPQDADLTRRALQHSAPDIALKTVATLSEAQQCLASPELPYDLLLTDLKLPDGQGLDLLKEVRARKLNLAVVVITGSGSQQEAARVLKAGADDYLVKRDRSLAHLHRVLRDVARRFASVQHRQRQVLRVLYAEPNPSDLDLTRRYFADHADFISLETVTSAVEVLNRFDDPCRDRADSPADVLLLDYRLPGMTALDLVKELRQVRGENVPVIMITGHGDEELAVEAFKLGVDEYVIKSDAYLQQLPVLLERVAHQHQLRLSEARYRAMFENQHAVMLMVDADSGRIVDANPAAEAWYGWKRDELCGKPMAEINTLDSRALAEEIRRAEERRKHHFHFQHRRADGSVRDVEVFSGPVTLPGRRLVFSIVHDITERRELEDQLRRKYKMEAVGMMAGGIAHNFNNNLAIMLGSLELLGRMQPEGDVQQQRLLENARTAVLRSRDLVQQIMTFSRQGVQRKKAVRLSEILDETVKLLKSTVPESIELIYEPSAEDCRRFIWADAGRIQEVVLNLCTNSVHAMQEKGTLQISLGTLPVDGARLPVNYSGEPGPFICLEVSDSGCGMDSELIEKIFDPFFSTKESDQGSGMGLATVQGIVEQHEGFIEVDSRPGQGTVFRLYFPEYPAVEEADPEMAVADLPRGRERILFVDDDEMLADLGRMMLSELGYEVTVLCDSHEALKEFRRNPWEYDLLFSDQTMPGLTGKELIRQVRQVRPDLPTVICTGYSNRLQEADAQELGINAFCMKPLELPELAVALRTALDGADA